MAIKVSSLKNISIPEFLKRTLVSISGGWSATPDSGGVITLNGNATFVESAGKFCPITSADKTIDLGPDIGKSLVITGYSESKFIGYKKKSVSFTDKLGAILSNKTPSRLRKPFIMCVDRERGSSQEDLIKRLLAILNINVTFPRSGTQKFYEPIWAKDNQAIVSLLNEILVYTGCIMYCLPSGTIRVDTIAEFFSKLKGIENSNTISSTTYYDGGPGLSIDNFTYRGSTQKLDKVTSPPDTVLNVAARKSRYSKQNGDSKTEVEEQFEIGSISRPVNSASINECYPIDTGRILKRVTTEFTSYKNWKATVFDAARADYFNSCNLDESYWPMTFTSQVSAWMPLRIITESWEYNTDNTVIQSDDTQKATFPEKVVYTMEEESSIYISNSAEATLGLGVNFTEYLDPEASGLTAVHHYFDYLWTNSIATTTSQKRVVTWTRPVGSYKWSGSEVIWDGGLKATFNERRSKIEQLKLKMDTGKLSITSPADFIRALSPYRNGNTSSSRIVGGNQRADWNPEFTVFPAEFKVVSQPWLDEGGSSSDGETISLDGGPYLKKTDLMPIGREIADARKQRQKSLSVTNINEIFSVGEIDAPSFSLDVDGIQTSGVYLNG